MIDWPHLLPPRVNLSWTPGELASSEASFDKRILQYSAPCSMCWRDHQTFLFGTHMLQILQVPLWVLLLISGPAAGLEADSGTRSMGSFPAWHLGNSGRRGKSECLVLPGPSQRGGLENLHASTEGT